MPLSPRSTRVRAAALALTAALVLAVGLVPSLVRPLGASTASDLRHWLSRALRSIAHRPSELTAMPGDTAVVFGPLRVTSPSGSQTMGVERFTASVLPGRQYLLEIERGDASGNALPATLAVRLNGSAIASETDFAGGATRLRRVVALTPVDTVTLAVSGSAGATAQVKVLEIADPTVLVFGPQEFLRGTGQPETEIIHFPFDGRGGAPYRMCILNGLADGTKRTSSATVVLNGQTIVTQSDVNQQVGSLTRTVPLVVGDNVMEVRVASIPTSRVSLCLTAADVTPPVLAIATPMAGQITRDSTIAVTGTVTDQTATRVTVNGAETVRNGEAWSATAALGTEGVNTLTVHAVDAAGNATDSVRTVIRDTEAPVVTLDGLPDAMLYRADSMLTVTGTITDRTAVTANANGQALVIDPVTHRFTTSLHLDRGANFVTVAATDAAAHTTTIMRQVTRDDTPPALAVTAPADRAVTKASTVHVTGTATALSPVTVTVNNLGSALGANGAFAADLSLIEGDNAITVVATSAVGLTSTVVRTVIRDTEAPVIALASPAAEQTLTSADSVDVVGQVTDRTTVTLIINDSPTALSSDGHFATRIALAAGMNPVRVTATDQAGNASTVTRQVVQDKTPPALVLLSPPADTLTGAATIVIRGRVSDASPLTLTVNGAATAVAADSTFQATIPLTAEGALSFPIVATDAAGNEAQIAATMVRDATPPAVAIVAPALGAVTKQATVAVQGTVADVHAVQVIVNGVAMSVTGGTFAGVVPLDVDGTNLLSATATDAAGNAATTSTSLTRDTQAPVITVESPANGTTTPGASIIVRGQVTDATPTTLTVAGASVTLGAGGSFETTVALVRGANAIALAATDQAGNVGTASVSVTRRTLEPGVHPDPSTVAPALDRTVASVPAKVMEFLYTGADPIQTGVVAGTIDRLRAASVRGHVFERTAAGTLEPLQGVTTTILGHAELGQTKSREDGGYDLAVNGGSRLTVSFAKAGYFPAQRAVDVAWQQYAVLDDVVLLAPDTAVTTIALGATMTQVARASVTTDADGPRQATLIVPAGTQATMTLPNGTTQPLSSLAVRATEYTVGDSGQQSMPGALPPTTSYTYAVQLSADQALAAGASLQDVVLSKPVPLYLENFLDIPVGATVPSGAYDARTGQWVAQDNGRVIAVLAVAGGVAQIDASGDGVADTDAQLAALGIDAGERAQLATLYQPGATLWRAPVTRFWPYDLNFGGTTAGVSPVVQIAAGPLGVVRSPGCATRNADPIACDIQVATQSVNVQGAPFTLEYNSARTLAGRERSLDILLTGATVPADLNEVVLDVRIAGQHFVKRYVPAPNLTEKFVWDGKDGYGRPVQGYQQAVVGIGHTYPWSYKVPASQAKAFGLACDQPPGLPGACSLPASVVARPRAYGTQWSNVVVTLGGWDAGPQGLGGFTPSIHHVYDPIGRVLQLGDGTRRAAEKLGAVVRTVAGTGLRVHGGDGGPAIKAQLITPSGVAVGPDGSVYVGDYSANRIRRIAADGTISTFAGNGAYRTLGEGMLAVNAGLGFMSEVAAMPDGSVLFTFQGEAIVWRVDPSGVLRRFAGGGTRGFTDGVPARDAGFIALGGIAVGPDGSVYISDANANKVRRVTPDGIITTIAGTGGSGFGTDEIPAVRTVFASPHQLAVAPDGTVYVVDMAFNAANSIRKITPDGVIHLVLRGIRSFGGSMAVAQDGTLYVADDFGLFKITTDGKRVAVSGNDGTIGRGFQFPESPVIRTQMASISGVAVASNGDLLVPISDAGRVQRVSPILPGMSLGTFIIPSADGTQAYVLDESGRHLETRDRLTGAVLQAFEYDGRNLVAITDASHGRTEIVRNAAGEAIAIVAPTGGRTELGTAGDGQTHVISYAGASMSFAFDSNGLLYRVTGPDSRSTSYSYDASGLLQKVIAPDSGITTIGRLVTAQGTTGQVTTATGLVTSMSATTNADGSRLMSTQSPDGSTITSTENPDGSTRTRAADGTVTTTVERSDPRYGFTAPLLDVTTILPSGLTRTSHAGVAIVTDPNGNTVSESDSLIVNGRATVTTYNLQTRTATRTSPSGATRTARLDTLGRIVFDSLPGLAARRYAYNPDGRIQDASRDGRTTSFAYDSRGRIDRITDPTGRSKDFVVDTLGRVISRSAPLGANIAFGYDSGGRVTSITPPGRAAYTFAYSPDGRLASSSLPAVNDSVFVTYLQFDTDNRPVRTVRAPGDTVRYAYDAAGHLTTLVTPQGTQEARYDPTTGQLQQITAVGGTRIAYKYDGAKVTEQLWTGPVSGRVNFAYDNSLRITQESVNGANSVTFGYTPDDLLKSAGQLTIERDSQTTLIQAASIGGVRTAYGFDAVGKPATTRVTRGTDTVYVLQLERDSLGRISSRTESLAGRTTSFVFRYDSASRLTTVFRNGVVESEYEYDLNGNRLKKTTAAGIEAGVIDGQDRMLSYGSTTLQYSPAGEVIARATPGGITRFEYSSLGPLTGVTLPSGTRIGYLVDGQGRRVGKSVDGTVVRRWLYADDLRIVAELDAAGQVVTRFVYATRANVPDYFVRGGVTYRIVTDERGSVKLVLNLTTATTAQQLDYDTDGRITANTNPGFQPFGYAGGLYDDQTGLTHFGAREYDAQAARWLTRDPLGFKSGETNHYVYAQNDPVSLVDPTGLTSGGEVTTAMGGMSTVSAAIMRTFLLRLPVVYRWTSVGATGVKIMLEAYEFIRSPEFAQLQEAARTGVEAMVKFGSREVYFIPDLKEYGYCLSGVGFCLGPPAFSNEVQSIKTALHELFRLETSELKGQIGGGGRNEAETDATDIAREAMYKLGKSLHLW